MTNITTKNKKNSKLSPQDWVTVVSSAMIIPLSIFIVISMIAGGSSPHTGGW
jgi:amino acid transporter